MISQDQFVKEYKMDKYERPSVAADIAVFAAPTEETSSDRQLKLLLVQRGGQPYYKHWALPGGFAQKGETVYETARRELCEETSLENSYLELVDIYSEPDRDPRGWIMSNTFMALIPEEAMQVQAGDDASAARWFSVSLSQDWEETWVEDSRNKETSRLYSLLLEADEIRLTCKIEEKTSIADFKKKVEYTIVQGENIAFDHAKVILCALKKLQARVREDARIVGSILPEPFTMQQMQRLYEAVLGQHVSQKDLYNQAKGILVEAGDMSDSIVTHYRNHIESY